MDDLGHCYEGEMAEDRIKTWCKRAVRDQLAKVHEDTTLKERVSNVNTAVGTSRDAVMANLRSLHEAHQKLTGGLRDGSV